MKNSVPRIHVRFKSFEKEQRDIWESFCLIDFYAPKIQAAIKNDNRFFPSLAFDRLGDDTIKVVKKNNIYGALNSLTIKRNFRRALLESVLNFESYITELIQNVYLDFPGKILSKKLDDGEIRSSKILNIIMNSTDREDIIRKLVEEKIRSIFYGNPIDVFKKDKAKLKFGTYFCEQQLDHIETIKKSIAIRNLIMHNNGVIDRKYIREADENANLGTKIIIDKDFLKESIYSFLLIAAHATRLVVENTYKEKINGVLASICK